MKQTKFTVALAVMCVLAASRPGWAGSLYNDAADGYWSNTSTWSPNTGYPKAGDTAILDSNIVVLDGDLTGTVSQVDEIVLNGGTLVGVGIGDRPYGNRIAGSLISVKSSSMISNPYCGSGYPETLILTGLITNKVEGSVTNTGVLVKTGTETLRLDAVNSGFSGGWEVRQGTLKANIDGAFGPGSMLATNTGTVEIDVSQSPALKPSVVKAVNGGTIYYSAGGPPVTGWDLELADGGNLCSGYRAGWEGGTCTISGGTNFMYGGGGGSTFTLGFRVSGYGTIMFIAPNDYYYYLTNNNTGFTGNWEVVKTVNPTSVEIQHEAALGLNSGGGIVTVYTGAMVRVGIYPSWTVSRNIILNGGTLSVRAQASSTYAGSIALAADAALEKYECHTCYGSCVFTGLISGNHKLTVYVTDGDPGEWNTLGLDLRNVSNSFSGLDVTTSLSASYTGKTRISANGAQGTGPIRVIRSNALLVLSNYVAASDWVLTNNLAGIGAIRVEDGSGAYKLVAGGSAISPGNSAAGVSTNTTGILTVDGALAFSNATLNIDLADTNNAVGIDYDRLAVSRAVTDLSRLDLNVNIATNLTPDMLTGQQFTILTCSNSLAGQALHSVSWPVPGTLRGRWRGDVVYGAGFVKLTNLRIIASGTLIVLQ